MVERMIAFVNANKLFTKDEPVLLAVSGGIDSVVMLHLFACARYNFSVAHCNFHLRGEDADQDAAFVRDLAEQYQVSFHTIDFDTYAYAKQGGVSIQMAARDLRYSFFEKLRKEKNYAYTATAHHANDSIETFFINLMRGTGISGLQGIVPKNETCVRPLLPFTRKEITDWCQQNNLQFREDKTNSETKYIRNKLRHDLLPLFSEIKPGFEQIMIRNMHYIQEIEELLSALIDLQKKILLEACWDDHTFKIKIESLRNLNPLKPYLYALFKEYDFTDSVLEEIKENIELESSGQIFYSSTHRLNRNRDHFILEPIIENEKKVYSIEQGVEHIEIPVSIHLDYFLKADDFTIEKETSIAFVDADKILYPLTLEKWEKGDTFIPYGMKGKKVLLSDFFNNNKVSVSQKERTWILKSNQIPVWLVGMRVDERFAVTEKTKRILKIRIS